jgi:PAS domain S-box-containing protein
MQYRLREHGKVWNPRSATGPRLIAGAGGRLLAIFAPILVLVASTFALAVAAWLIDGRRTEMLAGAGIAGAAAGLLAMILLYRQIRVGQAANRELQSVTARVSDIVEAAMDPIVLIDASQRIVLFNPAAETVFGWPREAVLGQPLDKLLPGRFHDEHRGHVERFAATDSTTRRMGGQAVLTGLRANGEEFPIEASICQHTEQGRKRLTAILRDTGERARAEARLARGEARLRGILDSAMDAIITIDQSQHIVLFNAAAEAMFGCPRDEALGAPLIWFIPERMRGVHADHVRRFGQGGAATRRMGAQRIVMGLRRNGEEFPIDASISQVDEGGGKLYTVILRDVSERVRFEEALRRSKEELRELGSAAHAAREQEMTRIARELHDELAQSLTALQMDVAWARERAAGSEPAMTERLARMDALLKLTVAATRRIASDLRPLMLDDLGLVPAVEWLVEGFAQRSGIPCELDVSLGELELPQAHATAVFRIVQESLSNVAKHAAASRAKVSIASDGGQVSLTIADDGAGFTPTDARKPNSYGLLGLRERASLLDGEASITSAPGEGTCIRIRLPLAQAAAS